MKEGILIPDGTLLDDIVTPDEARRHWMEVVIQRVAEHHQREAASAIQPAPVVVTINLLLPEQYAKPCEPSSTGDTRYWSIERAARECDVSVRTVAQWMADGKIYFRKPGGRVLIDPAELNEDLAKFRRRRKPKRAARRRLIGANSGLALAKISGQLRNKKSNVSSVD